MGEFIDMAGQIFGKITVVELAYMHKEHGAYWKCLCDCGNSEYFLVSGKNIRQQKVLSCGCLNKKNGIKRRNHLTGMKFGLLTVFGMRHDAEKGVVWLSNCDCGNEEAVESRGADLKSGKIKSCGCFRANKLAFGENAFNRLYDTYKRRATNKFFEFEFSKDDFRVITQKNCFYCGREPFQKAPPTTSSKKNKGFGYYVYSGIDRIDNSKGYTKENSVPCCGQCNVAKNGYAESNFIEWIKVTYENLKSKGLIGESCQINQ